MTTTTEHRDAVLLALDALSGDDREQAHLSADEMLVEFLVRIDEPEVAAAYVRAGVRVGFWYA